MQDTNLYNKQICVIGMGHAGLTLVLTFSDLGFKVVGVEKREKVLNSLNLVFDQGKIAEEGNPARII